MDALTETEQKKEEHTLEEIHQQALKRYKISDDYDRDEAELAAFDMKFENGEGHWTDEMLKKRKGRPCLTINLVPEKINRVIGDQRQNKPEIKVRPVDSIADPETAKKINGLIRAIINNSPGGESIIDHASESAVICGRGACRIITDYEGPDTFNQVIQLQWIPDVLSVKWDPGAQRYDKQDGRYMFVTSVMSEEAYKDDYPDFALNSWPADEFSSLWHGMDFIVVAEYFRKIWDEYEICMLEDGTVVRADEVPEGTVAIKRRKVKEPIIKWYKMNGQAVIEGPKIFPSQYFPILLQWGVERTIDGKRKTRGMVRNAIDPQRLIDYWESMATETVALAPRAPFIGTARQLDKYIDLYDGAARGEVVSALIYEPDPEAAGMRPEQILPPQVPSGIEHRAAVNKDNLKSAMGIYDASVGAQGNEISGVGIKARQQQGEIGTFVYTDNRGLMMGTFGMIAIDMIPRIFDAERVARIIGEDGKEERVKFGKRPEGYSHDEVPVEDQIYDPTVGKYDVVITVGPSYATQREEQAEGMYKVMQTSPDAVTPMVLPRLVKALDWPDADKLAEDLETLLSPQLQAKHAQEHGELQGMMPGEVPPGGVPPETVTPGVTPPGIVQPEMATPALSPQEETLNRIELAKKKLELIKQAKELGLSVEKIDDIGKEIEGVEG